MSPRTPKEDTNGKDGGSGDEEDTETSETLSLLNPTTPPQILPPTPTLGTSLSTPWRNHQGSAPSSPHLRRGGAWALTKERTSASPRSKSPSRKTSGSSQPKPRSPCPPGRKAIRWIGVNSTHEHVPGGSSSADMTSAHARSDLPTPHIIVSPEIDEDEPLFIYEGDRRDNEPNAKPPSQQEDTTKSSKNPTQTVEFPSTGKSTGQTPMDGQILDGGNTTTIPNLSANGKEDQFKETPTKSGSASTQAEILNMEKEFTQTSSPESSSMENSPTDDQGQPYFCPGNEPPVEENANQPGYSVHVTPSGRNRNDNNILSTFRSTSMASLDPVDPFMRKTRRNSMIGMMRRVSSTSNMGTLTNTPVPMPIRRSTSKISLIVPPTLDWKDEMNESLILCVSALYAKLVVVMGMAFPIAEIISDDVPLIFYNSFYLYLYFGSILFLIYAYLFLLRTKSLTTDAFKNQVNSIKMRIPRLEVNWEEIPMPDKIRNFVPKRKGPDGKSEKADRVSVSTSAYKPPKYTITESSNHGSMYLKMGAVIFGIGSMIYSGLEFGQYFELHSGANCANILMAISPVARMIFTFLQMYFIFLNSRVAISKHTIIARFGLMHMIGTNLCIWLNVLVQETKHEIAHLTLTAGVTGADLYPGHHSNKHDHTAVLGGDYHHTPHPINDSRPHEHHGNDHHNDSNHMVRRSVEQDDLSGCRRINLMGHVVNSASPFLFPCTIEYSLLCAGVLYVMWKNINVNKSERTAVDGDSDISTFIARKVRHHYSVDCARASRGLFMGIFILVLTIISLILFYVLISNEQFKRFAILEANIIEVSIYSLAIISVIVGMKQMRELEFILEGDIELDNILLIIAQAGVYIYTSFTIIGGYFSLQASHTLALVTAVMTLIQTTLQTLFILDGSRRCCYTAEQLDRKPGREMVTFLLVCNLAMWAISTFETSRADVHPTQLHFYGIWAWTIISHVSMPLAIFYRFHVTVCLGEIWKRSYKLKNDFIGL